MSFFKGFVSAIKEQDDRNFQREQLEEARSYDRERLADQRAYDEKRTSSERSHSRSEWLFRQTEQRKFELAALQAKRSSVGGGGGSELSETAKADLEWAIATLGGAEGSDDVLAQLMRKPNLATSLRAQIKDQEKAFAKDGFTFELDPKTIIENAQIYGIEEAVAIPSFTEEDIAAAAEDPELFSQMMAALSTQNSQQPTIDIGTPVPPKNAEGQLEAIDGLVESAARDAMVAAQEAGDTEKFSRIGTLLDNFGKEEGRAETTELYRMFGDEVINMFGDDRFKAWMSGAENNPLLAPFFSAANHTQTEEAIPVAPPPSPEIETTEGKPTFNSREELSAAADNIADGTIVVVGGEEFVFRKKTEPKKRGDRSRSR